MLKLSFIRIKIFTYYKLNNLFNIIIFQLYIHSELVVHINDILISRLLQLFHLIILFSWYKIQSLEGMRNNYKRLNISKLTKP